MGSPAWRPSERCRSVAGVALRPAGPARTRGCGLPSGHQARRAGTRWRRVRSELGSLGDAEEPARKGGCCLEPVSQLLEPSLSSSLSQSGLPAEAQAAGGGGDALRWMRARLQADKHTCTRWSPPFTKGLAGGKLPGGVLETSCAGQPGAAPGRALPLGSQLMRGAWEGSGRGASSQNSKAAQDNHKHILQRKKEGPRPPRPNWIPPFS